MESWASIASSLFANHPTRAPRWRLRYNHGDTAVGHRIKVCATDARARVQAENTTARRSPAQRRELSPYHTVPILCSGASRRVQKYSAASPGPGGAAAVWTILCRRLSKRPRALAEPVCKRRRRWRRGGGASRLWSSNSHHPPEAQAVSEPAASERHSEPAFHPCVKDRRVTEPPSGDSTEHGVINRASPTVVTGSVTRPWPTGREVV